MLTPRTERLLNKLQQQQREMLSGMRGIQPERLHVRPAANQWSALDVLAHLVKVEQEFVSGLRAGLSVQRPPPGLAERMRCWGVIAVMRSPMKVAMPASVAQHITPDAALSFEQAGTEWMAARAELVALITSLPAPVRGGVLRHPVGGWLTLEDTLRVLLAHTHHHQYQLRRLETHARETPSALC